ncbi:flagellar export protein FliJ [candidate division KSB1 bacterium 4484_188]|nr:MAG: flagellar export protein FliJ [candidate division KSB1 bacterium 4484_188]
MKKFEFRLKKVLEVKEQFLKKTRRDLAYTENLRREAKTKLTEMKQNLIEYCQKMAAEQTEYVAKLKFKHGYFNQLLEEIKTQEENISEIENRIDEIRKLLLTRQRDRKVLAKLQERQYEEYTLQLQKEEQNTLDEIATMGNRELNLS